MCKQLILILIFSALLPAVAVAERKRAERSPLVVSQEALTAPPAPLPANIGRTFIVLHSTLVRQGGLKHLNLAGTLSIHNTSASNPLVVEKIDYRDGAGRTVESYVTLPLALRPFASLQVIVARDDVRAGTGASFTIDWAVASAEEEPVIEALMTAAAGTRGFSFLSQGRRVTRR
jgi:hypothetical protein